MDLIRQSALGQMLLQGLNRNANNTWSANNWPSVRGGEAPPVGRCSRRKSVFAEHYDPEKDEEDENKVIHPKSDEQRASLREAVGNIFLFRSLDPEQMQDILDAMFERKVSKGEVVIRQGEDGDNFYVIESGVYTVLVKSDGVEREVGGYNNSGSFGELALMYNVPRAATIRSESDGNLWAVDRQSFRRILLKNAFRKRKMYEQLLGCVPMLATLEPYERMNLADALNSLSYEDKQLIIRQGDGADGMYFVENGNVKVTVKGDDGIEREVSHLTTGNYFGELALVTHRPRAASVYAIGSVRVAFLDVQAFERLLGPCVEIMRRSIGDYEDQLVRIFGSKTNISDAR